MKLFAIHALFFVLSMTGIARASEVKSPDFTAADLEGKAAVLLSTSADHTNLVSGTMLRLNRVEYKKNGKKRLRQLGGFFVDNPMVDSHSASEHMNVHWRALEPGQYLLERVLVNPMGCFETYVTFSFAVVAGGRAYLGDFHNQQGVTVVRDGYARDYVFFSATAGGEKPESFTPLQVEQKEKPNPTCQHHL
jgi:hypothetical protein